MTKGEPRTAAGRFLAERLLALWFDQEVAHRLIVSIEHEAAELPRCQLCGEPITVRTGDPATHIGCCIGDDDRCCTAPLRAALQDANRIIYMTRTHLSDDHPECAYAALGVLAPNSPTDGPSR